MNKLSIITINRNNAEGLRKTIESVVSQTFTDFEYIIIDGASTDNSVNIIREYADKITYWVSEPDKGIYNAMNKGILKATGAYLLFLNSGDWLSSNEILSKVFKVPHNNVDIITGDLITIQKDSISNIVKGPAFYRAQRNEIVSLNDLYTGTLHHPVSFIKRSLFDKYGLYDENLKIVADWLFFLKVVGLNGANVQYVDLPIVYFDMKGISNTNIDLLSTERHNQLNQVIPKQILLDYMYFNDLESKYLKLQNENSYLFHYRIVYDVAKFLNKSIRILRNNLITKLIKRGNEYKK